jgi:hypothetical protein
MVSRVFIITPPARTSAGQTQTLEARLARSVASLFGVLYEDADFELTWVSELSRLTLNEVARGCASPSKPVDSKDRPPERAIDKQGLTARGEEIRPISPTAFQVFKYDTLAGAVLLACNKLYNGDVVNPIRQAMTYLKIAGGDRDERISESLRLQVTVAMILEAYSSAPAVFLAGIEARTTQRAYFNRNRTVSMHLPPSALGPAKCEINPHQAPANTNDRPSDQIASQFEFAILDSVIRDLKLQRGNDVIIDEAPRWSGVDGAVASELGRIIERIGSPDGRGALRIVEDEKQPGRRTMQAFVPIIYLVKPISDRMNRWVEDTNNQLLDIDVFNSLDPEAVLEHEPNDLVAQTTVLMLSWLICLCQKHAKLSDEGDWDVLVDAARRLQNYVDSAQQTPRFAAAPALVAHIRILSARLSLINRRQKFAPFEPGTESERDSRIADLGGTVDTLIEVAAAPDLRQLLGDGRYMDMLFENSEALNGVRRDLVDAVGAKQAQLRARVTEALERLWGTFRGISESWNKNVFQAMSEGHGSVDGEFAHRLHNYASFLAFDIADPDKLKRASTLLRAVVLVARNYDPGTPSSASSAIPRPHLLQFSLEVAANADAALSALYQAGGFKVDARTHAEYALEYVRAIAVMPSAIQRRVELTKTDNKSSDEPNYSDATTAVNIMTAYLAVVGNPDVSKEIVDHDKSILRHYYAIADTWTSKEERAYTALAERMKKLSKANAQYLTSIGCELDIGTKKGA